MRTPMDTAHDFLHTALADLCVRHTVPGASCAVVRDGQSVQATFGYLNLQSRVPVTPRSVFKIGSVAKLFTATLAMQAEADGQVGLDDPLDAMLDALGIAVGPGSAPVTLRHLLGHSSGLSDTLPPPGVRDDRWLSTVEQYFPAGAHCSYSNAAYVLAAKVLEQANGEHWDDAIRRAIAAPLELSSVSTQAHELAHHRIAVGHVYDTAHARFVPLHGPGLPPTMLAAGATLYMSASDLARFGASHIPTPPRAGFAPPILNAEARTRMQSVHIAIPSDGHAPDGRAIGWARYPAGTDALLGHDGSIGGQSAYLRIHPESGTVVAMLANGGMAKNLFDQLLDELLAEYLGLRIASMPALAGALAPQRHVGTYRSANGTMWVELVDGHLLMRATPHDPHCPFFPAFEGVHLQPLADGLYRIRSSALVNKPLVAFIDDAGASKFLLYAGRVARRCADLTEHADAAHESNENSYHEQRTVSLYAN